MLSDFPYELRKGDRLKPAFQPKGHLVHVFGVRDGGARRRAVPRRLETRRVPHHDDCNR